MFSSESVTWRLIFQVLILGGVFIGGVIFFLKKVLFDSTQGAVNRLNRETETVRVKQAELNEKIKQANEELAKRRAEADALVIKMKEDAEAKAKGEREKIITKAREDAEEIISKAQKTKDEIRKVLEKESEIKAMDFATILMEEVLTGRTLASLNDALIEEFIQNLQSVDMSMVPPDLENADVMTTHPLSDKLRSQLEEVIQKKLERNIQLNLSRDAEIISGIVLRFGSLTLNGSLRHMLQEKGNTLKEQLDKGLLKKNPKV